MDMRQEKQAVFRICADPCCYRGAYTLGNSRRKGWGRMRRLKKNLHARLIVKNMNFTLE